MTSELTPHTTSHGTHGTAPDQIVKAEEAGSGTSASGEGTIHHAMQATPKDGESKLVMVTGADINSMHSSTAASPPLPNKPMSQPGVAVGAHAERSEPFAGRPPGGAGAGAASSATTNAQSKASTHPHAQSESSRSRPQVEIGIGIDPDVASDGLDEFITSPHGNNAIVERSPGGRYVRFMEKLGSGASKDVYRAYDTQEGIEVAWNVVHLAGVPKNDRNRIVNEVRLLERLHHHNIISFHGSWVNREKQQVNFVTEILSSGTLKSFINKVQVIRWKIAKRWAVQILKGLEYLHSQEPPVIHRDLKCENIFINGTSGDLRIGDLGLSTVHRNGKVLSVLGTPEFMAPDMYEENSYDEKVDIYAFGMCLLEIFTKEIPYSECNNPAQIYKKVTRGDPPDSLKRLKSPHAREFIELCLGHKGDDGKYIRPSATELLCHDFLLKRANDEEEVEVDPPVQEQSLREAANESSSASKKPSRITAASSQPTVPDVRKEGASLRLKQDFRSNSLEEGESDTFEEMPDSEINIRKVKVMMGRGKELEEDDEPLPLSEKQAPGGRSQIHVDGKATPSGQTPSSVAAQVQTPAVVAVAPVPAVPMNPIPVPPPPTASSLPSVAAPPPPSGAQPGALHYLVAAAVIENEQSNARPYEDDILKLVVTLPVEGQTQNVQFDFHLVEDDPVQVAKEMVAELGIPQGAVLEISETVSGLARAARVKQDKYQSRIQQAHSRNQPQGIIQDMQPGIVMQQPGLGQLQGQASIRPSSHQSMPEYLGAQQLAQPHAPHNQHMQQLGQHTSMPQLQMQPQSINMHSNDRQNRAEVHQQPTYSQSPLQMDAKLQAQASGAGLSDAPIQKQTSHVGHNQPQHVPLNQHLGGLNINGDYQPPHDPTKAALLSAPASYSRSVSVPNHTTNIRSVSNATQADVQVQQQQVAAFGHGQRHIHIPQQIAQATADFGQHHTPQDGPTQAPYDYRSQSRLHIQAMPQGHPLNATEGRQVPASYQSRQVETKNQHPPQYPHSSVHAQNQVVPQQLPLAGQQGSNLQQQQQHSQVSGQQVRVVSQVGQSQPYGHGATSQHQQPQVAGTKTSLVQQPISSQSPPANVPNHQVQHQMPPGLGAQRVVSAASSAPTALTEPSQGVVQPQQHTMTAQSSVANPPDPKLLSDPMSAVAGSAGVAPQSKSIKGALGVPPMDNDEDLLNDDELLAEEIRKLDEDYRKNMARAKRVFDSRMENLQRTQHQREAQHQKTLEKHQKERAEFEKRMQHEEIEQNRRIEHLQREWDRRREAVRQKQLSDAVAEADAAGRSSGSSDGNKSER